jgi:ABC-type polar amino acid transport system ATPase subunit
VTAASIRIAGVCKAFGDVPALRDVSLDVAAGEVAVLIGPSGCGKSTLLRCINGLETFDAGSIEVGSFTVPARVHPRRDAELLRSLRRKVGMVFQALHLFPHLDVLGNLVEAPVRVLGEDRAVAAERALSALDRVGLRGLERRAPRDLSGGQQQRVAIARALMMRPDALLFDEPTSALDPRAAADVLGVVTELAQDGHTMVLVTHGLGFARRAATKVHVLSAGSLVESGPPEKVLGEPEHETTKSLLHADRA